MRSASWVPRTARALALATVLPLAAPAAAAVTAVTAGVLPARAGAVAEAELAGGGTHVWTFDLPAGAFADLAVEQRGIDLAVTVIGADGRAVAASDNLYMDQGAEPVPFIAGIAGRYRIEVRAPGGRPPGRCAARLAALRPATPRDRRRIAAEALAARAEALRQRDDRPSLAAAVELDRQALAAFQALGQRERAADLLHAIAVASGSLERWSDAQGFGRRALDLFHAQGREAETAVALDFLGQIHRARGEPAAALGLYRRALAIEERRGERWARAKTLVNAGQAWRALGRTGEAIASYRQALELWRALGNRGMEAAAQENLGDLYQYLGEARQALDHLEPALAILEAEGRLREQAQVLTSIGDAWSRAGEAGRGIAAHRRALAIERRIGDASGEARTLNDLGWVFILRRDWRQVRDCFARARDLYHRTGDRPGEAVALANVAWADAEAGRAREAVAGFGEALPLLAAFGDRNAEAGAFLGLARARRRLGNLAGAREAVAAGVERIESLRGDTASSTLRAAFLAKGQELYAFEIDLLMELARRHPGAGWEARALAASERARARGLLDLLAESGVDLRGGVDPALLAREAAAGRRVEEADARRRELAGAAAPAQAAAERDLRQALAEADRARADLRRASPAYAALAPPRLLTVRQIQERALDPGTLLLEYSLGAERSFLWAVGEEGVSAFELPPARTIEAAARRAHERLEQGRQVLARGAARTALAELSRLVLAPAAPLLGRRHLLIVPDGALCYVPFAALPEPGSGEPLVAGHEIATSPSASSLAALRREGVDRPEPPAALAVVADPVFDAGDPRVRPAGSRRPSAPGGRFARLPYSREEAEAILSLASSLASPAPPAGRLLGFAASREAVLGGALSRYRVVHFATHGVLDTEHPELSGLMLSRVDERGRPRDGFVPAHELYRLRLPADLVVLSACRTALGREVRGEGLVGLTRGFQQAGARAVMVSLWEVDDRATAELMRLFYRGLLAEGLPPAAALRRAQEALRRQPGREAPYFWAGFILQGDGRAVPRDRSLNPAPPERPGLARRTR